MTEKCYICGKRHALKKFKSGYVCDECLDFIRETKF